MPRKDYEYFIENFHIQDFDVKSCEHNAYYPYPFVKAYDVRTRKVEYNHCFHPKHEIGIDVDIFPLDQIPEKKLLAVEKLFRKLLLKVYYFSVFTFFPEE